MPNHGEQERALDLIGSFENRLQQGEYKYLPRTTETTSGGEIPIEWTHKHSRLYYWVHGDDYQ